MESRIPLPTDNIFKFYALFGLLLVIFTFGSVIYVTKSTNEFMTTALVEVEMLKELAAPSAGQVARKQALERLMEVTQSDKKFFSRSLGALGAIGAVLVCFGFARWHLKTQPIQDAIQELQMRKLKLEVERLEKESAAIKSA